MSILVLAPAKGTVLADIPPPEDYRRGAPRRIAALGDVDGDHRADLASLATSESKDGSTHARLQVYGARSPQPIWSVPVESPAGCLAAALAPLGDVDGDGANDLALGLPPWRGAAVAGHLQIRSGRDGRVLLDVTGDDPPWKFGQEIARAADADGDGADDVAVLAKVRDRWDTSGSSADPLPRLEIRSSRTGRLISSVQRTQSRAWGGWSTNCLRGGLGIARDGARDLALRALDNGNALEVLSGLDGSVLYTLSAHPDPDGRITSSFPSDVAFADDVDGDGVRELLLGHDSVGNGNVEGAIYLQSPRTNELLLAVWGAKGDCGLGNAIAWLGDTDGDGCPEFAALTVDGVRVWAVRGVK